jgi:hypothetical protein
MKIDYTTYPKTAAAQKKFDKCKIGDIVWFTGGYNYYLNYFIGYDKGSFGIRAKVVSITRGIAIVPTELPIKEKISCWGVITKQDIMKTLARYEAENQIEEKEKYLNRFQFLDGDLAEITVPSVEVSKYEKMTKKQLIELLEQHGAAK